MSKGDNATTESSEKPIQGQAQSANTAWTIATQELSAPGSKIEKSNADLNALKYSHSLPNFEIFGMQANNDQLPGTCHHTDSVQMTENAKQINASFNRREHSLDGQGENTTNAAIDRSNDPTRVVLNAQPKTLDEVMQTLDKLDKALPDDDGLKWFNNLYKMTTQSVKDNMGQFKDPKFIEQLDVNFANMYLAAIKDNLEGKPVPEAWQPVFDARHDQGISPIQFAAAGMIAHIFHDLPYALNQTNKDLGINPGNNSPEHADFEAFNQVLRSIMPNAMNMLNKGALGHVANDTGSTGQEIGLEAIKDMRDGAWAAARALNAGGAEAYLTGTALNQGSGEVATQILHPGSVPIPGVGDVDNPLVELPLRAINNPQSLVDGLARL